MKPGTTTAGESRRRTSVPWRVAAAAAAALLLPACAPAVPSVLATPSTAAAGPTAAGGNPSPRASAPAEAPARAEIPVRPATLPPPAAALPVPASLTVDGTSISLSVVPVGVAAETAMELPESFDQAGWYRFGSAPGAAAGTAVIAGHIDTTSDRAPLSQLKNVAAGTAIQVGRLDAPPLTYRVARVELMAKDTFDGDALFRRAGRHELKVVTCGGRWLDERMDYSDNVIVTAVLE
ncbi:MAG: peptidase sortase [Pseudarthrobacter sp.]|nr:peptidase sortase [Pseudarthrobacter sp.]